MAEFGISVALLTPFQGDGAIDAVRLAAHSRDMMERGADSLTLFGTTGEGASIGAAERAIGLKTLMDAHVPVNRMILGVCGSAVSDAGAQIRQGYALGVRTFLLAPPFYFSPVDDDGLFDWYAQVVRQTDGDAGIILYNIPQVIGVSVSPTIAARLATAFPERIRAIKDSSGDWANAHRLLEDNVLPVLIGDERLLHRAVPLGCAGSITGMANLYPERMQRILSSAEEDAALSDIVTSLPDRSVIPGLKVFLARARADLEWERVRPPLSSLSAAARSTLLGVEDKEHVHA